MGNGRQTPVVTKGAAMLKLFLMILLAVVNSSAAAGWVKVAESDSETNTLYVDLATIRKAGHRVKMWTLLDNKTANTINGKSYISSKSHVGFDCKEEQWRMLYISYYSGNMGGGETVYVDSSSNPGEWIPIEPENSVRNAWEIACKKGKDL